jgi:NTE family protein
MGNVAEIKQVMQELQQTIAGTEEKSRVVISESLLGFSPTSTVKRELFGKKDCWFLPAAPAGREEADPSESLVVLKHPDTDYAKVVRHIARKVSRNFVGLALGSGAALGFAHIGVLKVLERERIPIDCLAGSSMGALIAGFYATGRSAVALEEIASRMGKFALLSKVDFDFVPVRGLIRGHRFLRFFESFFRDMTFEEAKIPLIITAMSLLSRKEILFNSGLIATAIRASISIPGIFHPVALGGDILVDGGIIDPLPIRPLADLGANKIIAVDVLPTSSDVLEKRSHMEERERRLDAKIRNRMLLVRALHQAGKLWQKIFDPNVVDIIVNTMQTMEHELAEGAAAEADICIRPSMPLFNWVEFHRSKEIIRQGELAAEAQLEDIKALVRQQVA